MPSSALLFALPALALFILAPLTSGQADQNALACSLIEGQYAGCAAAIPGFTTFSPLSQAACLCYSSSIWIPDAFDSYWASCLAGYSTANPDALASASAARGGSIVTAPCSSAGNVLSLSKGTPRPPPITNPSYAACVTLNSKALSCKSASPGFGSMSLSDQASCICYSGRVWVPQSYDNLWDSCINFLSTETALSSAYSAILSAQGGAPIPTSPCQSVGDILAGVTSDSSRTSTSATPAPTPSSGTATSTRTGTPTITASSPATSTGHAEKRDKVSKMHLYRVSGMKMISDISSSGP
jgi:hypothetical protein